MNIIELVGYFRAGGLYSDFCVIHHLNEESEVVEIYTKMPISLHQELRFFKIEKTLGKLEYVEDAIAYKNIFDFYYFLDAIEESKVGEYREFSNESIASRLLSYAINDA
jgi:hypothetical protein